MWVPLAYVLCLFILLDFRGIFFSPLFLHLTLSLSLSLSPTSKLIVACIGWTREYYHFLSLQELA
eukprot:m.3856 g.3856  ORF g.3856 m.3856 type:complete len:65 (+) comp2134_c0_seq1:166-360(+)